MTREYAHTHYALRNTRHAPLPRAPLRGDHGDGELAGPGHVPLPLLPAEHVGVGDDGARQRRAAAVRVVARPLPGRGVRQSHRRATDQQDGGRAGHPDRVGRGVARDTGASRVQRDLPAADPGGVLLRTDFRLPVGGVVVARLRLDRRRGRAVAAIPDVYDRLGGDAVGDAARVPPASPVGAGHAVGLGLRVGAALRRDHEHLVLAVPGGRRAAGPGLAARE